MSVRTIIIRDDLQHHAYRWPTTLLSYPLVFDSGEAISGRFRVTDDSDVPVPYQLEVTELQGAEVRQADLYVLADLPTGSMRTFRLHCDNRSGSPANEDGMHSVAPGLRTTREEAFTLVENDRLAMEAGHNVSREGALKPFMLRCKRTGVRAQAVVLTPEMPDAATFDVEAQGPLFCRLAYRYSFPSGATYTLRVTVIAEMDFVELDETISGFDCADGAALIIQWEDFTPESRCFRRRSKERIDAYADESGKLPFMLLPYRNWISWWHGKTAAFVDRAHDSAAAVFIRRTDRWDDGKYALWGSDTALGITFHYGSDKADVDPRLSWRYPLASGTRSTAIALYPPVMEEQSPLGSYVHDLDLWYELLHLDKVKDWRLEWDEPQEAYPRFFAPCAPGESSEFAHFGCPGLPEPAHMERMIGELTGNMNHIYEINPGSARDFFAWVPMLDMTARNMNARQFRDAKAASAFMAYVHMDEYAMPTRTMLAGHPNFLADMIAVPGMMAALFPNHPDGNRWRDHFARAAALNVKYHVRPAVPAWQTKGGRWTENIGVYAWAALMPMIRTAWLIKQTWNVDTLLVPGIEPLTKWLLHTMSPPIDGKRTYPPQGAHSGAICERFLFAAPYELRLLGMLLLDYRPLLGARLLAEVQRDALGFSKKPYAADVWSQLLDTPLNETKGVQVPFRSTAFTGYGFVLRAASHRPEEMCVVLQQIDEGPNYRWGRAAAGGNGVIYYYAEGQRFSHNGPEDVGDENRGDVQSCTNFGVLVGHEYRCIGRNELSEPLYDHTFAQFACVMAGPSSRPYYRSRSVLLSGNDYIVVYDEVGDKKVSGRFTWFVHGEEPFPAIWQLTPGAAPTDIDPGVPIDRSSSYRDRYAPRSKGRQYDGEGNFLTVVSHRDPAVMNVHKTDYGALVELPGRIDYVFRDSSRIRFREDDNVFDGRCGILRYHGDGRIEGALFDGVRIGAGGIELAIAGAAEGSGVAGRASVGFVLDSGTGNASGTWMLRDACKVMVEHRREQPAGGRLYVNGDLVNSDGSTVAVVLEPGEYRWEWTSGEPLPLPVRIASGVAYPNSLKLKLEGAYENTMEVAFSYDCGSSWRTIAATPERGVLDLSGLMPDTDYWVKVRPAPLRAENDWSDPYPANTTSFLPRTPNGLRLTRRGQHTVEADWGEIAGAAAYRLYRSSEDGEPEELIYEGEAFRYKDDQATREQVWTYRVSAVNGNGEGAPSIALDTRPGGPAEWDPLPEETFRRDTRSHEYGYAGFDFAANDDKPVLTYPRRTAADWGNGKDA